MAYQILEETMTTEELARRYPMKWGVIYKEVCKKGGAFIRQSLLCR